MELEFSQQITQKQFHEKMPSGNCVIPSSRHDAGNGRFSQFMNKKITERFDETC